MWSPSPKPTTSLSLLLTRPSPSLPPVLSLETIPTPTTATLPAQHILISISHSAIHPSDLLNISGSFPLTTFPITPGRDFSGTVTSPPSHPLYNKNVFGTSGNTQGFTMPGSHAEWITVHEDAVVEIPTGLTFTQAATIGVPFSTAALILQKAGLEQTSTGFKEAAHDPKTIFILGASGSVGSAVSQLASAYGTRVLTGTRNASGDVNTVADPTLSTLQTLTDGKGVDVVVDTVGDAALTSAAVKQLGKGGRVVFIAAPRGEAKALEIEMLDFYRRGNEVIGVNSLSYGVEEMAALLKGLGPLFEEGKLKGPQEGTWTEVPFKEVLRGYEVAKERGKKVVLVMR
ncbi:hypothetical protein VTL71DRAFT_3559 [Oculimacula yallundae]|uniref:Enoyl reductase (ER) domain-containing protein n=1 Tax=Oculimacula yallundae TaxID=86028 RepID=A0ABR4C7H8_9HELO